MTVILYGFILFNVLKVTLFNYLLITPRILANFTYKFLITLIICGIVHLLLLTLKRPVAYIIFYIVQFLYIIANMAYYYYFHNYLHILESIELFGEGIRAAQALAIPSDSRLLVVLLDLPLFILVLTVYRRISSFLRNHFMQRNLLILSGIALFLIIESASYAFKYSIFQFLKTDAAGETVIVERYGTLVNSIVDYSKSREQQDLIKLLQYGRLLKSAGKPGSRPNFVTIQLESIDAGVVNHRHDGKYIAPFLHSITANSVYFPYVLSYHMGGGTSDAEFSIINSIHPLENYPAIKLSNYTYPNSMLRRLSISSYTIKAFHGNEASYFNRNIAFPKMSFNYYYGIKEMGLRNVGWGAPDHDVFNFTLKQMERERLPFFYYVISMTTHAPFTNSRHYYNNKDYDNISDTKTRNYLNSVTYVDNTLKSFIQNIQKKYKNTYIFIWGDHTPAVSSKWYSQVSMHVDNMYMEFVPLFIITPDKRVYRENNRVGSFLDIAPTILEASKVPYSYRSNGMNLLKPTTAPEKIPYRGTLYDRSELIRQLTQKLEGK